MLSYFVNISDKYLKDGQNKKRVKGRGEKMEYKTDRHAFNSYKYRYKYTQDLKRDSQQAIQRRNRKNRAYRHRKEEYSDNLATTGSDEDGETLEIPSIENIRLAGTTQRKLLERRISLLRTQDKIAHLESRFSDRGSQDLNVYQPASSHSSRRTRTINTAIPEIDTEGSEYGAAMNNVQIVRKTARNHRNSVLKKAERLLHERKRHDVGSSSEADTEDSPRLSVHTQRSSRLARPSTYIARSRSRSLSSEKEYIHVPEVLDSVSDTNDLIDNEPAQDSRNAIQALPDVNRLFSNQRRKRFYLKSAAQKQKCQMEGEIVEEKLRLSSQDIKFIRNEILRRLNRRKLSQVTYTY